MRRLLFQVVWFGLSKDTHAVMHCLIGPSCKYDLHDCCQIYACITKIDIETSCISVSYFFPPFWKSSLLLFLHEYFVLLDSAITVCPILTLKYDNLNIMIMTDTDNRPLYLCVCFRIMVKRNHPYSAWKMSWIAGQVNYMPALHFRCSCAQLPSNGPLFSTGRNIFESSSLSKGCRRIV